MGFVELAAAAKFISNADLVWQWGIFTRQVVLASWVLLAGVAALYLWGWLPMPSTPEARHTSVKRFAAGCVSFAVGAWLATGLVGDSLGELESFLPPPAVPMADVADGGGGSSTKPDCTQLAAQRLRGSA